MGWRALLVAGLVTVVLGPAAGDAAAKRRPAHRVTAHLSAFASCSSLVGYARAELARTGGTTGVPFRAEAGSAVSLAPAKTTGGAVPPTAAAPTAVSETGAGSAGDAFSGTNDQETGVDEPDVVKTDGKRMFVLAGQSLLAIDVSGDTPVLLGSLALEGSSRELLLRGDRVLVIGTPAASAGGGPIPVDGPVAALAPSIAYRGYRPATQLTEVSVKDPAAMTVSRTLTVDGSYADARLTGGTVRVVLDTPPDLSALTPQNSATPQTTGPQAASAAGAKLGLRALIPQTVIRSRISGRTFRRSIVGCDQVRRPDVFSGLDLLTVMTIDLDRGLYSVDRDAVMAGAQVVYASDRSLYVASQRYVPSLDTAADVPAHMTTEIHRFDTSDPGRTTYAASGSVSGFVLNQYALSEYGGVLRVASTEDPLWMGGAQTQPSQSAITVLRQQGRALAQVGRVGGLGTGERIYAVRFIGPQAYLVTFRQIDPLYTLDLSDPANPKVAGRLDLTGYSAYLHPVGDGLLLGVGQDATAEGRRQGAQVSLFDVSDPAHPVRVAHRALGASGSSTSAEFDPHAFLWWAPTGSAVLPLQDYSDPDAPFIGAVGLHVDKAKGIDEVGRVTHGTGPYNPSIERSVVVGDRLYTLSDLGVASSRLATLAPLGFLTFPGAQDTSGPPKGIAVPLAGAAGGD
ncbi:MAG TPA: beta-propeller domain-containing protein [Solirubrobacteraceae bacterium]